MKANAQAYPAPSGPLVSRRVACELAKLSRERLNEAIQRGRVRVHRIKGKEFVSLDDADREAGSTEGGEA